MLTTVVYNQEGKKLGPINLPTEVFGLSWNPDLVHQALRVQLANRRKVLAHTKGRAEVRGGGRKPWRQKGTGRARHGSIRSPLWRGGGVTFGPTKERVFAKKINKKMRRKALLVALSQKLKDGEVLILDNLEIKEGKTKLLKEILRSLPLKKESAILAIGGKDPKLTQAARNLKKALVMPATNLNLVDLLNYRYLILTKEAIEKLRETFKPKAKPKKEKAQAKT